MKHLSTLGIAVFRPGESMGNRPIRSYAHTTSSAAGDGDDGRTSAAACLLVSCASLRPCRCCCRPNARVKIDEDGRSFTSSKKESIAASISGFRSAIRGLMIISFERECKMRSSYGRYLTPLWVASSTCGRPTLSMCTIPQ